jgi:hypothetical protein
MQVERLVKQVVDVDAIRVVVPVRYGEEDIPNEFFGRTGDTLELVLDLDTRRVREWPGGHAEVHMKVVDEGEYDLLAQGAVVASVSDYVPHCLPGEDGDYLVMDILEDGTIKGWNPRPAEVAENFGLVPEQRRR